MQVDIYINEEKFDTDSKTIIAETRQVTDFFDIRDRQTSYTNTFKLPKTDRNIALLGGMGIVSNTSIKPYRVHKISVKREGIETITDGIGYFKPTNDYFNMFVYNDNINLFDALGDKTLADLNIAFLNHTLNIESWLSSFNREDYIYALADYGKLDKSEFEIDYQVPSLYVKFLWEKIFSESGYQFQYKGRANQNDYNPFQTDEWNEIAITIDEGFPEKKESINPEKKLEIFKEKINQFQAKIINIWGNNIVVQELPNEINEYIRFSSVFDDDGLHIFSNSTFDNRSRIRIKEDGFYNLKLLGNFYNLNTNNAGLFIEKDGYTLFTINDNFPDNQTQIGFEQKLYLKAGEEFFVKIKTSPNENESYYSYDLSLELWLDNSVTSVNFSSYLSKIKQKDFVKDVIQYYGLMFRKNKNTYEFISFEELLDPLATYQNSNAVKEEVIYDDWSHKFHGIIESDSKLGKYAKNNYFRYKYDNSENTFADASLKITDETLEDDITLIQRPYRAPENSTNKIDNTLLRKCNFYEKEYNEDGTLKNVKPKKTEPFFFRVTKKETNVKYKIAGAIGSNTFSGSIPFMSFEGLDFNNVLPNRYAAFGNMVNYGQKIKAEIYLSVLDIHSLDFFKLKYFKQLGGLFYLSKPIKFIKNGINKVELIKIKSIEKRGEFSDDFNNDFNN